jgi:D-alanyl-D-alanine carboxypeptidase
MRGTKRSRRLLAPPRRRNPLIRPALLLIAFLVLGGRALAAGTPHHDLHATASVRIPPRASAAVGRGGGQAVRPAPTPFPRPSIRASLPPLRVLGFSGSWLRAHPIAQVPQILGRSAIVVDVDRGQILYWLNASARYPEASLTKLMTAMVAVDLAPVDASLTVTPAATQVEPDHMGISAGEQLTLRELLYGMLLDSGNDAAEAIAQGLTDRDQFIALMNEKAQAMRLKDTHFANPSGLDDPNHYSSAYDLAVMLATVLRDYPDIRTVLGTRSIYLPATATHKAFSPYNLDRLLWSYPGTIGGKPGYTDAAGYCLAVAAQRNGRTILAVVMGTTQHFTDGATLLDFGFSHRIG